MNKYEIRAINDIIKCTNKDNLERFLKDLKGVIEVSHSLQDLSRSIPESEGVSEEVSKLESSGFIWIDDVECNIIVDLYGIDKAIVFSPKNIS